MIPAEVIRWLGEHNFGEVASSRAVGGGCISNGARLQTTTGRAFFLKTNSQVPADTFAREAEGLAALAQPGAPRVPETCLVGASFLLMEDLAPACPAPGYWEDFARRLAALHAHTNPHFGFAHDNYLGSTPQPNPWTPDGWAFFAERRLLFQGRLAHRRGLLAAAELARLERLAARLPELIPPQPPSLIHGDLWSGNALSDQRGLPALIDPAAHYAWAEAELAMTALFGGFPESFYHAYNEARPLQPGWRARFPIYNLYHLLNHLNLFGQGYAAQVQSILSRYV